MEGLVCKDIYKSYGKKEVLSNVNLTLEKGKIYGLIGRNGVGKTTLLSILSAQGFDTKGEVTLDDEKVKKKKKVIDRICFSRELESSRGMKMTNSANFKIKNYLELGAIYFPNWDDRMAQKLLEEFDLKQNVHISKLSKGMLSMVTIIIALASKAEYTFLDEPVAGLDVIMRELFYKLLLEEYEKTGRTFVISTHIIEEASDIFEEVIIIKDKEILLKENTQDLIERSFRISGRKEDVDAVTRGLKVYQVEENGRGKGATVLLEKGQKINESYDINVQSLSLQKIFIDLCEKV